MRHLLAAAMLVACGTDVPRPAPLDPLPPPAPVMTDRFRDAEACAQCHLVDDTKTALHDATGANISPVLLWRSSMMGLAARDPYYLAAFAQELGSAADRGSVEKLCTRCHAPAGSEEVASANHHIGFDELVAGSDPAALLARGGVTCTACHQINNTNFGEEASFSGGFSIGYGRQIFGRYGDPVTSPMMLIVNYTPTLGVQIDSAALCGTCHTVIVGTVAEQATYLEWRSSSFATMNQPCQRCHVPATDDTNATISTVVAGFPNGLSTRQPVGRHVFVGGNSYVLQLIADGIAWSGANLDPAELAASSARDVAHLATAAKLTVTDAHREGTTAVITVQVENQTGHKLPTGYPSRRMWLHVTASSGGHVAFESGRTDGSGALVDASGNVLARQPHRTEITAGDQVQVWEAEMIDGGGHPTDRTLAAVGYGKDDRILPAGFAPKAIDRPRVQAVGADGDLDFVPGSDRVTYRIANAPANLDVAIELDFQALRPDIVDTLDDSRTPAGTRFVDLARARPVAPVPMATLATTVP